MNHCFLFTVVFRSLSIFFALYLQFRNNYHYKYVLALITALMQAYGCTVFVVTEVSVCCALSLSHMLFAVSIVCLYLLRVDVHHRRWLVSKIACTAIHCTSGMHRLLRSLERWGGLLLSADYPIFVVLAILLV